MREPESRLLEPDPGRAGCTAPDREPAADEGVAEHTSVASVTEPGRESGAAAIRLIAECTFVEPSCLRASAYRAARARVDDQMPSALAIALAFGGWQRACEHATASRSEVAVGPVSRDRR